MNQPRKKKKNILSVIILLVPFLSGIGISFLPFIKAKIVTIVVTAGISLILGLAIALRNNLHPRLDKSARQLALQFIFKVADRIEFFGKNIFWFLTVNFKRKYLKALFVKYRKYQTNGNNINTGLNLLDVYISLRMSYGSTEKTGPKMFGEAKNEAGGNSIWDFIGIKNKDSANRRLMIAAAPGAGKTTLLEHLTLVFSGNLQKQYRRKASFYLPILIDIKRISRFITEGKSLSIEEIICRQDFIKKEKPNPVWFKRNLLNGKCLVMLDGLDEAGDRELQKKAAAWIDAVMQEYSASRFIITTRPFGSKDNHLLHVDTILEIKPFSTYEMENFLQRWYAFQKKKTAIHEVTDETFEIDARFQAAKLLKEMRNLDIMKRMAANPLHLTMLVSLYNEGNDLPENLFTLYQQMCDVILGRQREGERALLPSGRESNYAILQTFALRLMIDNRKAFDFDYWEKAAAKEMMRCADDAITTRNLLDYYLNECGILRENEYAEYEFTHSSFQEFLAAVEINEQNKIDLLTSHLDDTFWHNTIKFYGCRYNITEIIRLILKAPSLPTLTLAYECLIDKAVIDADVKEKIDAHLLSRVHSKNRDISRLGAEYKLGKRIVIIKDTNNDICFDDEFISVAEYQLFIDDMYSNNKKDYRPSHWKTGRFPQKEGDNPVIGILPDVAAAFCRWLSEKEKGAFLYRLPHENELSNFTLDNNIKIWHTRNDEYDFSPLQESDILNMKTRVEHHLLPESGFILAGIKDFLLTVNKQTGNDFTQMIHYSLTHPSHFHNLDIDFDFILDRAIDLARARDYHHALIFDLELFHILERTFTRVLDPNFSRAFDLDLSLAIDLAHTLDLSSGRDTDESDIHKRIEFYFVRIKNRSIQGSTLIFPDTLIIINFLIIYLFFSLEEICKFSEGKKKPRTIASYRTRINRIIPEYMSNLLYLIILDLRIKGELEPFEGLKIVGEKIGEK